MWQLNNDQVFSLQTKVTATNRIFKLSIGKAMEKDKFTSFIYDKSFA